MSQIAGTGIDVIEVDRIERALTRPSTGERFRARVFTSGEIKYCESRGRPRYQSYAARFAAKEATMKALGTGWNRNVGWNEIEVVRERGKAPTIALSGKAAAFAQRKQITRFHLSITHTAAQAIAHVIAETAVEAGRPNPLTPSHGGKGNRIMGVALFPSGKGTRSKSLLRRG